MKVLSLFDGNKALGNTWQCDTISYILEHLRKF